MYTLDPQTYIFNNVTDFYIQIFLKVLVPFKLFSSSHFVFSSVRSFGFSLPSSRFLLLPSFRFFLSRSQVSHGAVLCAAASSLYPFSNQSCSLSAFDEALSLPYITKILVRGLAFKKGLHLFGILLFHNYVVFLTLFFTDFTCNTRFVLLSKPHQPDLYSTDLLKSMDANI